MQKSIFPTIYGNSDSFNYTFNSMGSIYGIIILTIMMQSFGNKDAVIFLHYGSILGIVLINRNYYNNFKSNHITDTFTITYPTKIDSYKYI